jgi:hypothetical protein
VRLNGDESAGGSDGTTMVPMKRREMCRLCATCKLGFRRGTAGTYNCLKCPESNGMTTFLLIIGSFGLLVVVVGLVLNTMSDAGDDLASDALQKIFVNYMQAASLALAFPLEWPDAVQDLLVVQSAISTVGEFFVNPDCQLRVLSAADLFYSKSVAYAFIPLIILVAAGIFWLLAGRFYYKSSFFAPRGIGGQSRKDPNKTYPIDQFILCVVILLYLVYPTLCKQTFRLFTCVKVKEHWYLSQDMQTECYLLSHLTMVLFVGVPQIIAYVIGLPLGAFVIMYKKHAKRNSHHVKYRYGILYSGFRRNQLYWECIVALRKVSIAAVTVLVSEFGVGMQIHVALFILMVSLTVHLVAHPFMVRKLFFCCGVVVEFFPMVSYLFFILVLHTVLLVLHNTSCLFFSLTALFFCSRATSYPLNTFDSLNGTCLNITKQAV